MTTPLPYLPDTLEGLLAAHAIETRGTAYNLPDLCYCGAKITPAPGGAAISRRRAHAHAEHVAEEVRGWIAWHGTAD